MTNPFQIFGGMIKAGGQKMLSPFEQMVHSQRIRSFLEAMRNSRVGSGTMMGGDEDRWNPQKEDYTTWHTRQAVNRKVWW